MTVAHALSPEIQVAAGCIALAIVLAWLLMLGDV